jgi:type I restriction enzyme S subunit
LDAGFLRQVVQSSGFIEAASAAYGTHMPRADWKSLAEYSLALPPTVAEQSTIATILSDMDDEIAAVEQKVAKARQIKQGMMQELLTGRVRFS